MRTADVETDLSDNSLAGIDQTGKAKSGWFGKTMNVLTLDRWSKYDAKAREAFVVSWNLSSWVTIGQITVGAWVRGKVTTALPWLAPMVKSLWAKVCLFFAAVKETVFAL